MGGGSWTTSSYSTYTKATRGLDASTFATASLDTAQIYTARRLDPILNPKGVMRECCDTEEHPETIPVILALDVTGSMGSAANKVAQKLNDIMTSLYKEIKDVEFMIMAIGDLSYDVAPIQASQFESDIRIAEQLDKVWFEAGGGGNNWESYTAAWYFGLHNTKLDCWKRGKKGIIITMGDEPLNPYLPNRPLNAALGSSEQSDVETDKLFKEVTEKFDVYHISVDDPSSSYQFHTTTVDEGWKNLLREKYCISTCAELPKLITAIVTESANNNSFVVSATSTETTEDTPRFFVNEEGLIAW